MAFYVYRMQNKMGMGCYASGLRHWQTRDHRCSNPNTPGPYYDLLILEEWEYMDETEMEEYRFGFKNLNQALAWFSCPEEVENLRRIGFTLKRVRAESVIVGDKQVIFILE